MKLVTKAERRLLRLIAEGLARLSPPEAVGYRHDLSKALDELRDEERKS
jgi:hypothetical protein